MEDPDQLVRQRAESLAVCLTTSPVGVVVAPGAARPFQRRGRPTEACIDEMAVARDTREHGVACAYAGTAPVARQQVPASAVILPADPVSAEAARPCTPSGCLGTWSRCALRRRSTTAPSSGRPGRWQDPGSAVLMCADEFTRDAGSSNRVSPPRARVGMTMRSNASRWGMVVIVAAGSSPRTARLKIDGRRDRSRASMRNR
jgi:hypothetical protein